MTTANRPIILEGVVLRDAHGVRLDTDRVELRNGRIAAVGAGAGADGPADRIDLGGALLLPGFCDSHLHFLEGSLHALGPDLHGVDSRGLFARRVAGAAARTPDDGWVTGSGWNETLWPGAALPSRDWIDEACAGRPAFLLRHDMHLGVANTAALERAGVTASTPDPPGGAIDRDDAGEPTGILRDNAMGAVYRLIPATDDTERRRALEGGFRRAAAAGLTCLHELDGIDVLRFYRDLDRAGEVPVRIVFGPPLRAWEEIDEGTQQQPGVRGRVDRRVRVGPMKTFLDGSLGSHTARFFEPYADAPDDRGIWVWDDGPRGDLREIATAADAAGRQIAVHAIGDEAVAEALALAEHLARTNGPRDRRFRIEHAQHFRPDDFARAAALGVIASVQPAHLVDDGPWAGARIGAGRCATTYAFRSLADAGVPLAFGSDWPVAPLEPLAGIMAAVTRRTADGTPFGPDQAICLADAIAGYTSGAAWAGYAEQAEGRIAPGFVADLVALDPDPYDLPPDELHRTRVRMTIADGRVIYDPGRPA